MPVHIAIDYNGPGEWTYTGVRSACCDETCFGHDTPSGRDHVGPICNGCGDACEVVCAICDEALDDAAGTGHVCWANYDGPPSDHGRFS